MKLLIVSHTPHYWRNGELVGWGPTLREIDRLGELFDTVVHLAPLMSSAAPASAIPYKSSQIRMRPVRAAGGDGLWNKLSILVQTPVYITAMLRELGKADVVHVRCPANISLIALLLLTLLPYPRKRWFKYAGNWKPSGNEALSYRFQRWFLGKRWHRGVVTVNGEWPDQPPFVHSFLNPCLQDEELVESHRVLNQKLDLPVRFIFAGRLDGSKGVGRVIHILARLKELGVPSTVDLIGDGVARPEYETLVRSLALEDDVKFHGWLPRARLGELYARAHFMILPSSSSEGWPKVLSEAMAYGAVPVASNVSSIPQYLKRFDTGRSLDPNDIASFADSIQWYLKHPDEWKRESLNGQRAADLFSYSNYLKALHKLLCLDQKDLFKATPQSGALQS